MYTLALIGLGCFIAAIVGGGQALGWQIPILPGWARWVLGIVGVGLVVAGISNQALREEEVELLFTKNNKPANSPGAPPPEPTEFPITQPFKITSICGYHLNDGAGEAPGNISLQNSVGETLGRWEVTAADRDAKLLTWQVKPNRWITAGTYRIIDSENETWAWNDASPSLGHGMSKVKGRQPRWGWLGYLVDRIFN
jgi:hypothetical protein